MSPSFTTKQISLSRVALPLPLRLGLHRRTSKKSQPHPCVWHPCLSSCTRLLVVLMVVSAALVLGDPTYWPALVGTLP